MALEFKKKYLSILIGLILIIAVAWLGFRACSGNKIIGKDTYYIGRDSTWYPLNLRSKEKNMIGFVDDLMEEVAKLQEIRIYTFEVGTNALYDGLALGNYDGVYSILEPNVINRGSYEFSDPYYLIGPVLIVDVKNKASSLDDMKGKIIGIERGGFQVYNIPEPADILILSYNSASEALENLDRDIIDGVIVDALRAHVWVDGFYKGKLRVATSPMSDAGLRIVTLKTDRGKEFIKKFNESLKTLKENGTYKALIKKWELVATEVSPE